MRDRWGRAGRRGAVKPCSAEDSRQGALPMDDPATRYDDLRALVINCTLKRSPERSHTQGLIDRSCSIMTKNGVEVDQIRAVDHDIATGGWPDMTEHGWPPADWPGIYQPLLAADTLVA